MELVTTLVVIKENGNCKFNREEDVTVVAIPVAAEVAAVWAMMYHRPISNYKERNDSSKTGLTEIKGPCGSYF